MFSDVVTSHSSHRQQFLFVCVTKIHHLHKHSFTVHRILESKDPVLQSMCKTQAACQSWNPMNLRLCIKAALPYRMKHNQMDSPNHRFDDARCQPPVLWGTPLRCPNHRDVE
jgi:hypothetical protein